VSSASSESIVPVRSAALLGSFAMLLVVLACLVRTLAWHIPNTGDADDKRGTKLALRP